MILKYTPLCRQRFLRLLSTRSSIDTSEVAKFKSTADEWWGNSSSSTNAVGPLRLMNPVRCQFIRRWTDAHYGTHDALRGLKILDVGCGGGLLSETLARAGAHVTGIDASADSILAAKTHYETVQQQERATSASASTTMGTIEYRDDIQSVEHLLQDVGPHQFDIVCALEVIEHVPRHQQSSFVRDCRSLVRDDGCMFVSTLNRTARSLALAIFGAEIVLRMVPPGTHDWGKFVTVEEMKKYMTSGQQQQQQDEGDLAPWNLQIASGMQFNPIQNEWFENELDTEVNYITYSSRNRLRR